MGVVVKVGALLVTITLTLVSVKRDASASLTTTVNVPMLLADNVGFNIRLTLSQEAQAGPVYTETVMESPSGS